MNPKYAFLLDQPNCELSQAFLEDFWLRFFRLSFNCWERRLCVAKRTKQHYDITFEMVHHAYWTGIQDEGGFLVVGIRLLPRVCRAWPAVCFSRALADSTSVSLL